MDDMAAIAVLPDPVVRIIGVGSKDVAGIWPLVVGYIEPVLELDDNSYSAAHVLAGIQEREAQLWVALVDDEPKGCVVSRIIVHPNLTELFCRIVGGEELESWMAPMMETLTGFAKAKGCVRIEGAGRRGWARAIPGMKEVGSLMRMKVQ